MTNLSILKAYLLENGFDILNTEAAYKIKGGKRSNKSSKCGSGKSSGKSNGSNKSGRSGGRKYRGGWGCGCLCGGGTGYDVAQ
jgi:hypothetical protein